MNEEEFGSDSESDDSDFCPTTDKLGKSDSDSIDEKDEAIFDVDDDDDENSKKKRKTKKKPQKSQVKETFAKLVAPVRDLEAEKRKEDALWAEFLGGSDPPAKPDTAATSSTSSYKKHIPKEQKSSAPKPQELPKDSSVFEFAGEEVVVQQNVSNSSTSSSSSSSTSAGIKRPSTGGGGLSSVLNQISKKNKLSILQKTKIDWDGFKTNEGIVEEIATHNRGRDG